MKRDEDFPHLGGTQTMQSSPQNEGSSRQIFLLIVVTG